MRSPSVAVMAIWAGVLLVERVPLRSMEAAERLRGALAVLAVRSAPVPMVRVPPAALKFSDGAASVMRFSPWPMVRSVAAWRSRLTGRL